MKSISSSARCAIVISAALFLSTSCRFTTAASADTPAQSGWDMLQANNLNGAATAFRHAVAKDPMDVDAYHGLSIINTMQDNIQGDADLMTVVRLAPSDPRAWFDWHILLDNSDFDGMSASEVSEWKVLAQNPKAPPQLRSSALEAIAECDRLHGDIDGAAVIWRRLAYIRQWESIGPFDNVSKSGYKKAFEPEINGIHLDAQTSGEDDLPVQWRRLPFVDGDGTANVGRFLGNQSASVFYSATTVDALTDQSALLWYSPVGASKIWLNGKIVLTDEIYRTSIWTDGETFAIPVQLTRGINTLVVKSADDETSNASFMLRITDSSGIVPLRLAEDPTKAVGPLQPAPVGYSDSQPVLVELASKAPENRQNLEALSQLLFDYGDYDAAMAAEVRAIALAPNDGWLMWEKAKILRAVGRDDDARTARDACRAVEPDNLLAQDDYVDDDNMKSQTDARVSLLHSLLKRHPNSSVLLTGLSYALRDQNLDDQALSLLARAAKQSPGSEVVESLSEAYSDAAKTQEQLNFDQTALTRLPGDVNIIDDIASVLDSQQKYTAAIAYYQKSLSFEQNKDDVLNFEAEVYADDHQPANAIAETLKEIPLQPENADLRGRLGDMYADAGQKSAAVAMYDQAIALDPSEVSLHDKISRLVGGKPALDLVPAISAQPLINAADKDTSAGIGDVRVILDECREVVYPDGASDAHYHTIIKIQSKSAVDIYQEYPLNVESSTGKVANLRARLIKPDGKVVNPDTDDTTTTVDLPSLGVGDVIDMDYDVTDYTSGALAHNFWTNWFFGSKRDDVDLSEYSLITPKNMPLNVSVHGEVAAPKLFSSGNWTIHQWKEANLPAVAPDYEALSTFDTDNWIDISTVSSWSNIISWYSDIANSACTPDDFIRAKASELTSGDTTAIQKIHHIVAYVRGIQYQSTPFRLSAYVPTDGRDVIRDQYGDCKDKAALLCSLLQCIGVEAQMVLLNPRESGVTERLPSPRFDHAIARVRNDDVWLWVDATADQLAFGFLPFEDQGVPALVIDPKATGITVSPISDIAKEKQTVKTDVTLSDDGSIKGSVGMDYVGNIAWILRTAIQRLGATEDNRVAQALIAEFVPGSTSDASSFLGTDSPDSDVTIAIQFHNDNYAAVADKLLLLKVPWSNVAANLNLYDQSGHRNTPIELGMSRSLQQEIVHITAPSGYTADSLPGSLKINSPWGECDIDYSQTGSAIEATRTLEIDPQVIPADQADDFVAFLKKIAAQSEKQIAFKSAQ